MRRGGSAAPSFEGSFVEARAGEKGTMHLMLGNGNGRSVLDF